MSPSPSLPCGSWEDGWGCLGLLCFGFSGRWRQKERHDEVTHGDTLNFLFLLPAMSSEYISAFPDTSSSMWELCVNFTKAKGLRPEQRELRCHSSILLLVPGGALLPQPSLSGWKGAESPYTRRGRECQ